MATIVFELVALAWIRWRFFAPAFLRSSISVAIGGAISANVSGCARRSQLASPIPNG
jgi:FAD/FMN-containing dehydrogenase